MQHKRFRWSWVSAVSVFAFAALPAFAQNVTGKWEASFDTQVGQQSYTFDFVVSDGKLTGTVEGNLTGKSDIAEGKVEGNTISFVENGNYQGMPLRIVYTGTIESAQEIKFSRNVADAGMEEFVAKPAGAPNVTGKWTASFETQVGTQSYTFDFVVADGKLTGTVEGNLTGKSEIAEGKVEGNTISFVENGNYEGMPLRITYTGTIESAQEIKLSRMVGDFGGEEFVAKPAQ